MCSTLGGCRKERERDREKKMEELNTRFPILNESRVGAMATFADRAFHSAMVKGDFFSIHYVIAP